MELCFLIWWVIHAGLHVWTFRQMASRWQRDILVTQSSFGILKKEPYNAILKIKFWDVGTGDLEHTLSPDYEDYVATHLQFSTDGPKHKSRVLQPSALVR